MGLHVSRYTLFLLLCFICTSITSIPTYLDAEENFGNRINRLKLLIKESERKSANSIQKQIDLEYEILAARRIIKLIDVNNELVEEELQLLKDEVVISQQAIKALKTRTKEALVRDYIYRKGKANLFSLFVTEGVSAFIKKIKYVNLVSSLRLRQLHRLKAKYEEAKALDLIYTGTQKDHELLNEQRTDIVVDLNSKLRSKYAQNAATNRLVDSLKLQLLLNQSRHTKVQEDISGFAFPVETGLIVRPFGKYQHPTERKILLENTGVDILSLPSSNVFAAGDGTISSVFPSSDSSSTVVLKHKELLFVYGDLGSVRIKIGDKINQEDVLGTITKNVDSRPILHVEVWQREVQVDPEKFFKEGI